MKSLPVFPLKVNNVAFFAVNGSVRSANTTTIFDLKHATNISQYFEVFDSCKL